MPASPKKPTLRIYFSDVFGVPVSALEAHGAFNISLIRDLPLFIDPFLLFNSKKPAYQALHSEIIRYLRFLRDKTIAGPLDNGLIQSLFRFKEVKQNWLGFSQFGNNGSGLGHEFAVSLYGNLGTVFRSFGEEEITKGHHLEKLSLFDSGVGRDHVSDFTVNLTKRFLLEYTQRFALEHLEPGQRGTFKVPKVWFNYDTESWASEQYELPFYLGDFVILTPKDILTKDEEWINRSELLSRFDDITAAVPNEHLRGQINNYFRNVLPRNATAKEEAAARAATIRRFPELIEYYIRLKEDQGDQATAYSKEKVDESEELFIRQVADLALRLAAETDFYRTDEGSFEEAKRRINYLKHVIEDKDGYKAFYHRGKPVHNEQILQIMYQLVWYATEFDVNREVNNGRGPADFAVSRGARNKSIVELKLASNSRLARNLQKQAEIYAKAGDTQHTLKGVMFFDDAEYAKVRKVLKDLGLEKANNIVLIDARKGNKPSASKA